jgi:hypothetical protein
MPAFGLQRTTDALIATSGPETYFLPMRSTAFDRIFAALGPIGDRPAIVYDNECPFCSTYVKLFRLREAIGPVKLIAARERSDLVEAFREAGVSLNDGMAVIHRGEIYWGDQLARADEFVQRHLQPAQWLDFREPASLSPALPRA